MLPRMLQRLETADLEVSGQEMTATDRSFISRLSGCLSSLPMAQTGLCTACGEPHEGEVIQRAAQDETNRFYIRCPTLVRTLVPRENLMRWWIQPDGIAAAIAKSLGTAGQIAADIPDRLWFLGLVTLGRSSLEVFFARGLNWPDGPAILGSATRLLASRCALVIVPNTIPPESFWKNDPPLVCALTTVATIGKDGLVIDREHLAQSLGIEPARKKSLGIVSFPTPPNSRWSDVHITMGGDDARDQVTVTIKRKKRTFTFQEAGFGDRRSIQKPSQNWTMLRAFAQEGGKISLNSKTLPVKMKTKQAIHAFREALQRWIPEIEGSPVEHDKESDAYVCAFNIGSASQTKFPLPADVNSWEHIGIGIKPIFDTNFPPRGDNPLLRLMGDSILGLMWCQV